MESLYMEIKSLILLIQLLVIVPVLIGTIWANAAGVNRKIKYIAFSWLTGFLTMMAAAQVLLVPMVLRRMSFTLFFRCYTVLLLVLCILAVVLFVGKYRPLVWEKPEALSAVTGLFIMGAVLLIGGQAGLMSNYQHIDDDDSRFVTEEVMAVEQGMMYTYNPVNGKISYWDMGEVRKDMTSPWTMFVAYVSKASGVAPAILSHKYLPLFLIPLCYVVYALMGLLFFKKDIEKTAIFLILVSALHIYGYSSTHTVSAVMLLRIWQGKALVAALLLPAAFYLICELLEKEEKQVWYALTAVAACAACLASGIGITTVPVVIAVGGVVNLIHRGGVGKTVKIWCTAIPSAIWLLCYLFFWQLLKVYF